MFKPSFIDYMSVQSQLVKFREFLKGLFFWFLPSPRAWKGAAAGILLVTGILILSAVLPYLGVLGIPVLLLRMVYYIGLPALMALGVFLLMGLINGLPGWYRKVMVAGIFFILHYFMVPLKGKLVLIFWVILAASLLAGSLWVLAGKGWKKLPAPRRVLLIISMVLGSAGMLYGGFWFFWAGKAMDIPEAAAMQAEKLPPLIQADDPSSPGSYEVKYLTYGSGTDRHRPEYGDSAGLVTSPVDGSPFVDNWKKFHGWAREKYWGFDLSALPLNARVWYPCGPGPYPLVLVVHGNHLDRDYSDPGYEYLGELMASRGFIFASVDENFLNGTWSDVFNRLKEENDARAWLLLKHLEYWEKWNGEEGNPFAGKVDMERISLIGHSRGGEAVSIAACFNRLPYYPDDALVPFDFNFHIRSVIPIAPVDGQYKPAGVGTFIENTDYFTLQGSHDMDMQSYHGARQFQRVRFTDSLYHVKAGLYVYGANHGQFNTTWGRNDVGYPNFFLFNRRNIMPAGDQQKIAQVFISAFLELTLNNRQEYLPLFMDYRSGRHWLPETVYLNQFEDSRMTFLCDFEEDLDLSTPAWGNGHISGENLTVWKEKLVPLKWGPHDTRAVYLGWNREASDSAVAVYRIEADSFPCSRSGMLVFSLADAGENSRPERTWLEKDSTENGKKEPERNAPDDATAPEDTGGLEEEKAEKEEEESKSPLDMTLELTDRMGNQASVALGAYMPLQPQPEAKIMKWQFLTEQPPSEIVFQAYAIPMEWFAEANPQFDPGALVRISLVFDRSWEGVVVLDNLGIRNGEK
ncbi:MAG TPA: MFS transporter [Bacteroidetes bacterium]|nr:MFS transporter [Bacteroidota bacterium]